MQRSSSRAQSSKLHWIFDHRVLVVLCAAICVGAFYARAMVSVSTGILAAIGLIAVLHKNILRSLLRDRTTLALVAILGVYLLSGLNSSDTAQWMRRIVTNTPYIVLPVALFAFGPISRKHMLVILSLFIGMTAIASLGVLADYVRHYETYNELYLYGKTIPTPIIHVRFSYFVAIACLLSLALIADGGLERWQRNAFLGTGAFLLVFLHILAVRTGLLAFYGGGLITALVYTLRNRKYREALIGLLAVCALLVVAYQALPSFKNKIGYMRWDLKQLAEHGAASNYSDNLRITSIRHGLELLGEHPLFGVGIGDIEAEMDAVYEMRTPDFPAPRRFPPISQYVFWLAAFGIIGTAAIIFLLLYPLYALAQRSYLVVALYAATLLSCLAETTLQLQLGKTIFLLLLCAMIQFRRSEVVVEPISAADGPSGDNILKA